MEDFDGGNGQGDLVASGTAISSPNPRRLLTVPRLVMNQGCHHDKALNRSGGRIFTGSCVIRSRRGIEEEGGEQDVEVDEERRLELLPKLSPASTCPLRRDCLMTLHML